MVTVGIHPDVNGITGLHATRCQNQTGVFGSGGIPSGGHANRLGVGKLLILDLVTGDYGGDHLQVLRLLSVSVALPLVDAVTDGKGERHADEDNDRGPNGKEHLETVAALDAAA